MVRLCATCTALLAFAVSIFRGLAVDNPTDTILIRALWSLVTFFVIGLGAGWVGQAVAAEYGQQMREREARTQPEAEASAAVTSEAKGANGADAPTTSNDEATAEQQETKRAPEGAGARTR